jgi:hypothetical protein
MPPAWGSCVGIILSRYAIPTPHSKTARLAKAACAIGQGHSLRRHLDHDSAVEPDLAGLIRGRIRNWGDSGHAGHLVGAAALDPKQPYRSGLSCQRLRQDQPLKWCPSDQRKVQPTRTWHKSVFQMHRRSFTLVRCRQT